MDQLSQQEKVEMVLIYGESRRDVKQAILVYAERFPNRRTPSRASFYRVIKQFSEEGSVQPKKRRRRRTATDEDREVAVLAAVNYDPHVSSRELATNAGMSKSSVLRILKRHKFHPYHVSLHQQLHGDDYVNRLTFCRWAQDRLRNNNNFFQLVLFSDECTFTNHGEVNRHNMHYWAVENPRWLREVEHQRPWSVNVWCGILGDRVIGQYFIDGILTGAMYSNFLTEELPLLLKDVPLETRSHMWYQHDGCPAHYAHTARDVLNNNYHDRWIGRAGPINWPARSPDLTPPDFFLWGYLKEKVYCEIPTTPDNMKACIRNACARIGRDMLLRTNQSFIHRVGKCIEVEGHHFEHLLR